MTDSDQLDETFSALASPTRRAILARLAQGEATVNELAAPFDMTLPAISKHIRVLEGAGLITRGRNAQFRPCSLNTEPLEKITEWTDRYRHIWETRFDRMESILHNMKGQNDD